MTAWEKAREERRKVYGEIAARRSEESGEPAVRRGTYEEPVAVVQATVFIEPPIETECAGCGRPTRGLRPGARCYDCLKAGLERRHGVPA